MSRQSKRSTPDTKRRMRGGKEAEQRLLDFLMGPAASDIHGLLNYLQRVAESDISGLWRAERSYGNSWKRRGGVGAFMMLARKWDRIEQRVAGPAGAAGVGAAASPAQGDLFAHIAAEVLEHIDADRQIAADVLKHVDADRRVVSDVLKHIAVDRRAEGIIDDIRDLRRYLLLVEAEMVARGEVELDVARDALGPLSTQKSAPDMFADSGKGYLDCLPAVSQSDVWAIEHADQSFAQSWRRGRGADAYKTLAEKWQRIERRLVMYETRAAARYDVFEHIAADRRAKNIMDDIRDLRRYLMLVEAEMAARGDVEIGTARDNRDQT
jgi:hypothetical protein